MGACSCKAQSGSIADYDSLVSRIQNHMDLYKFEEAVLFAQQALEIAQKENNLIREGDAYFLLANSYLGLQRHWTALEYYKKSFEIRESLSDIRGMIEILNFQGIIFWRVGMSKEGLTALIQATELMERVEEYPKIIAILNNIGLIHNSLGNTDKALEYFNLAQEKCNKFGDRKREAAIINNIGTVYQKNNQYNEALLYFFESLKLKEEQGDKWKIASTLQNIGGVLQKANNLDEAEKYFQKSIRLSREVNNKIGIASTLNDLGKLRMIQDDYGEAINILEEAIQLGKESNSKRILEISHRLLSEAYSEIGDYEKACHFLRESTEIKDQLINEENTQKISEMQEKFESERREKQIALLKKNATIQQLKYRRNFSILITILLLFIIAILISYFVFYKNKVQIEIDKKRLEDTLKLKADFTAMLVHDLRSPISAILGTSDLIRFRTQDEKVLEIADMIRKGSLSMLKLVNEMLDMSKFEAGKMKIVKKPYQIDALVRESCQLLFALAETSRIELKIESESSLPEVEIDPTKIDQVVTNIVANAIKFSPEGSSVKINVRNFENAAGRFIEVSVEDNGPGIDPELKELVFDKYAQLHNKKVKLGSGLGLAISKLIIDAHQGEISFKPAPETGTIFYFRIPV